jgi:serine/threonine-protein kinase
MALAPGARLGPYEIVAPLGAGGMGEVYRARDTRLDRTVAIKVLAADRMADPQMRQRFEREARAVAALTHPNICHLNDVGQQDGVDFLVMEYLDGETLAARLARAAASRTPALPLDEVFRHAIQIAEALAEAHRHGIVHRDLKPGNVILTKTGVKLLDFGLAKLQAPAGPTASLSTQGPTREAPLTGEGSIMGTWPYMAPEQLEGKDTDARTDIFAFGALLYEMTSGARAFEGDSHASLIAAILERDPIPLVDRRLAVPPALDRVVRKCLAKLPDARWQSARDLADELKWIAEERGSRAEAVAAAATTKAAASRRHVWPWAAAVVAALGIGAAVAWNLPRRDSGPSPVRRFAIHPPADAVAAGPAFALSPDGRALVYAARTERGVSLHVWSMDQQAARSIAGTESGYGPLFSPDGESIVFSADGTLKKTSLRTGAAPFTVTDVPNMLGAAWLPDNSIVVGRRAVGLFRVAAEGGVPVRLSTPATDQGEIDHHNPQPLGGGALLITRHRGMEAWDVAVLDLATTNIRVIVPDAFDARYLPTGHLVFARGDALHAAPFDIDRLDVTGASVVMVNHVRVEPNNGLAHYSVAADGTLAYVPAAVTTGRRLVWAAVNRPVELLPLAPRAFSRPSLSPDGRRLAVQVDEGSRSDIWLHDFAEGTMVPFTQDGASEAPIWTPDGQQLTFTTNKAGRREIFGQRVDGTSTPELLVTDRYSVFPGSWSADGRRLTYLRQPPTDETDIRTFNLETRSSTTLIGSEGMPQHPRESPDGRWIAYSPFQRGGRRVLVTPAGGQGAHRLISSDNVAGPVWSRDSQRLYYRTRSEFLFVDVKAFPAVLGKPTLVGTVPDAIRGGFGGPGYDVAPDGRVLAVQPAAEETAPLRFEIVLNWTEELKQRVPTR